MTIWNEPNSSGPSVERRAMLADVAHRYYQLGESQQDIAEALDVSRSNVSRLLDAARKANIVRFVINHPMKRHAALEQALKDSFGINEVVVVAGSDPQLQLVGRFGARWLAARTGRLAIGWGRSVQAAVDQVAVEEPKHLEVIQIGGDLSVHLSASGHELTQRLAAALGGTHRFLHAPALVESELVATELLADAHVAAHLERARAADAAIIGIGLPGDSFGVSVVEVAVGRSDAAAANVAARLLGDDGKELDSSLARRVIALDLDDIRAIPEVTGLAAGAEKGRPIAASLRAELIDVLLCDQPAAAAALEA